MDLCKNQILKGCDNLLKSYKRDFWVSNLQIYFPSSHKSFQLNGFFTSNVVRGMFREDFGPNDSVF